MNPFLISLMGLTGVVFLWGVVSPRSQWHVLIGWTRGDPRLSEPGSVAYAASRMLSLIGMIVLVGTAASWIVGSATVVTPVREREPGPTETVWGQPRSYVVDRVFTPLQNPPEGLVLQAITGYQLVDGSRNSPDYLFASGKIREAGMAAQPGFLGVVPLPGTIALDTADLIVHVRGDDRCIPQRVVLVPVDGGVQIGVFFGQPTPVGAEEAVDTANCDPDPPGARTRGFLIPIDILGDLADGAVQSLGGEPIALVSDP